VNVFRRSFELIVIMVVAWITMLLVLIFVDQFIVPITFSRSNYFLILVEAIVKLFLAGIIALIWLGFWSFMVEYYKKYARYNA